MIIEEDGSVIIKAKYIASPATLELEPRIAHFGIKFRVENGKTTILNKRREYQPVSERMKLPLLRYLFEEKTRILNLMIGLLPEGKSLSDYLEPDSDENLRSYLESVDKDLAIGRLIEDIRKPEATEGDLAIPGGKPFRVGPTGLPIGTDEDPDCHG